jgi:branched-chain amino acid transport system permease protein
MNIATFTSKRFSVPAVLLLIVVLLATAPLYLGGRHIIIMTDLMFYSVLTVSWVMFSGPTRYMSLASAAFFGIGLYTSALLFSSEGVLLPLPAVIIIGGLVSFCLAFIIGAMTLRLRGIYFAIFTFGLVELGRRLIQYYEFHITGVRGRIVTPIDFETAYFLALIIVVAVMVTAYLIRRSRYGLALQGIGAYEEAAAHMGVNTTMTKVITFGISAFFMGAIGAAVAPRWLYIDPTTAFNLNYTFLPVLMALVGGMGQLYGPILGAVGFGYLRYTLLARAPYHFMLIFGITLVVVIIFLPNGLGGLIQNLRNRLWGVIPKSWKGGEAEQHANT